VPVLLLALHHPCTTMSTTNTTKPATLDDLSTLMTNLTATMNEVLKRIIDNTSRLMNLEDKVTGMSTEVSSLKADQDRLHITINNIQRGVRATTPLLPEIL
jgi:hypothetical protein